MSDVRAITEEEGQLSFGDAPSEVHPMRHLVFFDHYATPPGIPGILRQHDFALELKKKGWKTTIVNSGFGHAAQGFIRPVSLSKLGVNEELQGVRYRSVYSTPYSDNGIRRYINILSYFFTSQLRGFKNHPPSVVIGVNPHLLGALAGWFTAKRYRVPFIFEVHDLWPESLVQLGLSNKLLIRALEVLERFLYRQADAIITVTDGISEGVRKKAPTDKLIKLIPSGASVQPAMDPAVRSRLRKEKGWEDRFVVMWAGSHGKANHLDTILEAAKIVQARGSNSNIRFVLVGDGPEKPRLVKEGKHLPNVEFLDPIPASEVPLMLELADAGVIVHSDTAAVRGARPTKMSEYMAVGLPIISNLQGEPARLILQANCGTTVPPMRPDLLAQTIEDGAREGSSLRSLGQNGIEFVRSTNDRALLAATLEELLEAVLTARAVEGQER